MEDNFLPDDQLDGLFREASDQYRTAFDEGAWQSMASKLDTYQTKPTAKPFAWKRLSILLVLIGFSVFMVNYDGDSSSKIPNKNLSMATKTPLNAKVKAENAATKNTSIKALQQNLTTGISQQQNTRPNERLVVVPKQKDRITASNISEKETPSIEKLLILNQEKTIVLTQNKLVVDSPKTTWQNTLKENQEANIDESLKSLTPLESQENTIRPSINFLKIKYLDLSVALNLPLIESPEPQPVRATKITFTPPRPKVGIRLLAASDLNSISGINNVKAVGKSVGVVFEYEFMDRLKLQTGFINTQKDYQTSIRDYNLPEKVIWPSGIKPSDINAQSSILDIPINIRFDAIRHGKSDFFINTGLSSYLMISEKYHFGYDPNYGYLLKGNMAQEQQLYRSSDYLFSTFNLSVGYETQLKYGFSVQVEPYLKAPLKGIGWGNVNMYSTGVFFSIKHGL